MLNLHLFNIINGDCLVIRGARASAGISIDSVCPEYSMFYMGRISNLPTICHEKLFIHFALTHCGLVKPYGNIDLCQHWLR